VRKFPFLEFHVQLSNPSSTVSKARAISKQIGDTEEDQTPPRATLYVSDQLVSKGRAQVCPSEGGGTFWPTDGNVWMLRIRQQA
jgi:hypothetical protein